MERKLSHQVSSPKSRLSMAEKNKRRGFEISPESVEEFNLSPKDLK